MGKRAWKKYPYFEEEGSADVVLARIGPDAPPRLARVMGVLVRHLHEAIKEIRPSHDEWLAGIRFLTRTGQMCTDWRQEFILLSDTLGVTMLVDAIQHARPQGTTENTLLGPFYVDNPPRYENGANLCLDGKGEPLAVRGRVLDAAGAPVAGATVDVWQANDDGFYDVQQRGVQPDMNLRGVLTTNERGEYWFETVKPRFYPIPFDGPVGQLLGALGRGPNRAAHIHFIVKAEGFETVITHVFTPDCPYLEQDAVFGVKESLIGDFVKVEAGGKTAWSLAWDFVLARTATSA